MEAFSDEKFPLFHSTNAFAAVAPDRAYVAGDRIHMLRLGMPGHPVVGGVGNVRYPALR